MTKAQALAVFEEFKIRRVYDEESETWFFSVVDIVAALTQQPDHQLARNYWKVLKNRLKKEGSESVTKCNRLKLTAADGKAYLTDVADPETILRIVQSVPSPKAEPIKLWLAKVGYERIQDMSDPARSQGRALFIVVRASRLHRSSIGREPPASLPTPRILSPPPLRLQKSKRLTWECPSGHDLGPCEPKNRARKGAPTADVWVSPRILQAALTISSPCAVAFNPALAPARHFERPS